LLEFFFDDVFFFFCGMYAHRHTLLVLLNIMIQS
jgi:hypothetical protein